jgi:hypothetical protein
MPRPRRLDFKGAIHLVRIAGRGDLKIYFDLDELAALAEPVRAVARVRAFEKIITVACQECGAVLYAYCIESNACALVMGVRGSPLEAFMRRVCGQYSRYLHRDGLLANGARPYAGRYESKMIAPAYLAHAVRRVHGSAKGLVAFSSNSAYAGGRAVVPLETEAVREALAQRGYMGVRGYQTFMVQAESEFVTQLFERGSPVDSRVVGDRAFVIRAHEAAEHPPASPSREHLIATAASIIERKPEELFESTQVGALGRALVAWFAMRSGAATLTETGKWFSVSAATLGHGIRHYRRVRPELFRRELPSEGNVLY